MPKKQKQLPPELGDYVRLRNRESTGYLIWMNNDEIKKRWAMVWWDGLDGKYDREHPKYVGYVELEKMK